MVLFLSERLILDNFVLYLLSGLFIFLRIFDAPAAGGSCQRTEKHLGGMKMKRRVLVFLLALCLAAALVPVTAFAGGGIQISGMAA